MNFDLTKDQKQHTEKKHDYRLMADYPQSTPVGEFYWNPEDAPPGYKQDLASFFFVEPRYKDSFFFVEVPVGELFTQHLGGLLSAMPTYGSFCIAGGAAMTALNRRHPSTDVDVFTCHPDASPSALRGVLERKKFVLENDNQRWSRFSSRPDGGMPIGNPVQVIKLFSYHNEYHVINSFDFRVCQVAIRPSRKDGNGICTHCIVVGHPLAIRDSFEKQLVLASGTEKAVIDTGYVDDLLWRVAKYRGKGFDADGILHHPKVVQYLKDNPDFVVRTDIPESA